MPTSELRYVLDGGRDDVGVGHRSQVRELGVFRSDSSDGRRVRSVAEQIEDGLANLRRD